MRLCRKLAFMVVVALAIRVIVSLALYPDQLPPQAHHWKFGWEMGQVAASLVTGHGYGNPLPVNSGPTAAVLPVYPLLIAGVFKIFGTFTTAAAIAMLVLNSLFASLTVIPVHKIAQRIFGATTSVIAGWMWALFPMSIFFAASEIWEWSLTALLVSLIFLYTLKLRESSRLRDWVIWAVLWGALGMTSATMLTTLPPLGLWIVWRRGRRALSQAALAGLLFLCCIMPWTIRNYRTFHHFVPMRDNFWLEVHRGFNGDMVDVTSDRYDPVHDGIERRQWVQLGETGYFNLKRQESFAYILQHPATSAALVGRHVVMFWTGFWSLSVEFLGMEPMHVPAVMLTSCFTLLALAGWRATSREGRREMLIPFGIVYAVYPLIYYFTHPSLEYRLALDPLLVVVGSYGALYLWRSRTHKDELAPQEYVAAEEELQTIGR